jgi:hypothetical protein
MYNLMKMARVGLLVAAVVSAVTPSSLAQSREGSSLWDSVKTSQDADDYKAYLDKYPDGTYAPLAKRRISALESHGTNATTLPPAAGPNSPGPSSGATTAPVTMTECEGTDNCATWTFLGTQGNGQWPSGEMANLNVARFDNESVVIRRTDSVGSSAGLTAEYKGSRQGNRIGGDFTSSWPGHWSNKTGNWYATIDGAARSLPSEIRVCDFQRCGTWTWNR